MSDEANCGCMECRVRAALVEPGQLLNVGQAAMALGEVLAEILAHVGDAASDEFIGELRKARLRWKDHPRVAVQRPHAGQA